MSSESAKSVSASPFLKVTVVTLFPEIIEGTAGAAMLGRAIAAGALEVRCVNPRDFTTDKHRTVDDTPYGGGGGMVMKPEPLARCLDSLLAEASGKEGNIPEPRILFMCPQGRRFDQPWATELAGVDTAAGDETPTPRDLILVCGRYEAIDERIYQLYGDERLSIGDYVLSGGEPAAFVVLDALARLLPGVLGCATSAKNDSFSAGTEGLLDAPHYTRPEVFRGEAVPPVLLSGDHGTIDRWRQEQSLERTRERRPDLLPPDLLPDLE